MPEMRPIQDSRVTFDRFVFDPRSLELYSGGELVRLQQQPARVLALLIERAGELVTREELRQTIWGDQTFVDFSRGLNYCVSQIRTALADTADSPKYIETLRGRGYRFVGSLGTDDEPALEDSPATPVPDPSRTPGGRRRLVILAAAAVMLVLATIWAGETWLRPTPIVIGIAPFAAGAESVQQWSAGLHAQLLAQLSRVSRLPVVDGVSAPGWHVEGRVDRSGEQYRVTVTLRKPDGAVRWSDVFDGPPGDWIDAQNEMAFIITQAIRYYVEGPSSTEGIPRRVPRRPIPPGFGGEGEKPMRGVRP